MLSISVSQKEKKRPTQDDEKGMSPECGLLAQISRTDLHLALHWMSRRRQLASEPLVKYLCACDERMEKGRPSSPWVSPLGPSPRLIVVVKRYSLDTIERGSLSSRRRSVTKAAAAHRRFSFK